MRYYLVLAGLAGGVLGGMGMGGGTLLIPILTILLGMPQLTAQAINLISFIPMAIASLVLHARNGLVEWRKLLVILPLAVAMSALGAYYSDKLPDGALRRIFGCFMIAVGIIFIIKTAIDFIGTRFSDHKY